MWRLKRPAKTVIVAMVLLVAPTATCLWLELAPLWKLASVVVPTALGMVWIALPLAPNERRFVRDYRFTWLRTARSARWSVGNVLSLALFLLVGFVWVRSHWRADMLTIALSPTRTVEVWSGCGIVQIQEDVHPSGQGPRGIKWSVGHRPSVSGGPTVGFGFGSERLPSGAPAYSAVAPWWFPTLILAIAPTLALIRGYRRFRREAASRCLYCGYDLSGNVSGVCPECGTEVK